MTWSGIGNFDAFAGLRADECDQLRKSWRASCTLPQCGHLAMGNAVNDGVQATAAILHTEIGMRGCRAYGLLIMLMLMHEGIEACPLALSLAFHLRLLQSGPVRHLNIVSEQSGTR